ncbi:HypC/HybG/HupF family hydrogenase formation chaperone [Yinghuangia seranimata]|uniref:HypC/HybG/HupF family hydrogenase formation chaperone n=1 Tax=Yinghuangia seranimata TaxID=408067 RepID=UPI00248AC887|nr:HypC/HybG/HupF family hydrogenase formation chaperone [Yinghuangia seranimata]MDI2128317.1 HypC/HybG/HupF family hydrogenase formation chaperone [Yinghuangia seranimata]
MCLAVPGRVTRILERDGTRMAVMDFGGVEKDVCLEYLPDLRVDEYAIVHVGFALQRLDEESARKTLGLFEELGLLQEEFGDPWEAAAASGPALEWAAADAAAGAASAAATASAEADR